VRYCSRCRAAYGLGERFCPLDGGTVVDAAEAAKDGLIGRTLASRYLILREIGKGGMGVVYEAEHVGLGKRVAVKLLLDTYSEDREVLARFHMEARNASRIGHENIIDILDIGEHEGRSFIVMEFLEGTDLRKVSLTAGALPFDRALSILRQICRGLSAAHQKGIIHRDMKPENVFVIPEKAGIRDFVKLMDFGISKIKAAHESQVRLTQTGAVVGTPLYMAPEQALAKPDIDHRVDVYSVGVMMYELFTGRPPFEATTYLGLITQHVHERPPSPRKVRPELPAALEKLILRALEKEPEKRFATIDEMAAALPPTLSSGPMSAASSGALAAAPGGVALPVTPPSAVVTGFPTTIATVTPRARLMWIGIAAAALVAIGVLAAVVVAMDGGGPPAPPAAEASAGGPAGTGAGAAGAGANPLVQPLATHGAVDLKSEPSGARVFLDGRDVGVTPLVLPRVPVGEHTLRLELEGYVPVSLQKVVRGDVAETFVLTPQRKDATAGVRPQPPRAGDPVKTQPAGGANPAATNTQPTPTNTLPTPTNTQPTPTNTLPTPTNTQPADTPPAKTQPTNNKKKPPTNPDDKPNPYLDD
jgi:serine/threonine-protein kinase